MLSPLVNYHACNTIPLPFPDILRIKYIVRAFSDWLPPKTFVGCTSRALCGLKSPSCANAKATLQKWILLWSEHLYVLSCHTCSKVCRRKAWYLPCMKDDWYIFDGRRISGYQVKSTGYFKFLIWRKSLHHLFWHNTNKAPSSKSKYFDIYASWSTQQRCATMPL